MKRVNISNFMHGIYGGLALFFIGLLQSLFPFLTIGAEFRYVIIWGSFLCIILITVYFLIRRQSTLLSMLIRTVSILASYVCVFIIGSQTGLIYLLYRLVSKYSGPSSNNVSGLAWVISYFTVVFVCVATLSIKVLFLGIVKLCNTRGQGGQGDGLREP